MADLARRALAAAALALAAGLLPAQALAAGGPPAASPQAAGGGAPAAVRIAGDYADQTSALVSAEAFPEGCGWVVLARDDDFADAMSATGLAGALRCPIVLTGRHGLSEAAAAEVGRLGAKRAYVVGGPGAMPGDFESELAALGCSAERVYGEAAWDTSVACAERIALHGGGSEDSIVAMSLNFQDALSISSFAYRHGVPIYLQTQSGDRPLPDAAAERIAASSGAIYVPGGPGAVDPSTVEGVFGAERVVRIWGEDGYDTSNQIARYMVGEGLLSPETVVVACGAQAPRGSDALAGAALAGSRGGVVLLANGNEALGSPDSTALDAGDSEGGEAFLRSYSSAVRGAYVLGGAYVMPESVASLVGALLAAADVPYGVVYAEGVEDMSGSGAEVAEGGLSATVPADEAAGVGPGDVVVLPATEESPFGSALEVTDVSDGGGGDVVLSGVAPGLWDVYESVNITTDLYLADGLAPRAARAGAGASAELPDVTVPVNVPLGDTASLEGEVGIDSVGHMTLIALPGSSTSILSPSRFVYVGIEFEGTLDVELGASVDAWPKDLREIELPKIPVVGEAATATGFLITPTVVTGVEGGFSFGGSADFKVCAGKDLQLLAPLSLRGSSFDWREGVDLEVSAEASIGVRLDFGGKLLNFDLAGIGCEGGAKTSCSALSSGGLTCADVDAWCYAKAFAELFGDVDALDAKISSELVGKDNSPWSFSRHYENGARVDRCTRDDSGGSEAEPGGDSGGGSEDGSAEVPEGLEYSIEDGKATITGYAGRASSLEIPSTIEGCPVTSIGDDAFSGCTSLESVSVPSGVTSIDWGAFSGCSSLASVSIPSGVTSIGDYAFYQCSSLENVSIPSGVTSIGGRAFYGCSSLENVIIPEGVTSIGSSAFFDCDSLADISIPEGVTSIGNDAFSCCDSLESIEIPSSVASTGGAVCWMCPSLSRVSISSGVTSIDWGAFSGCSSLESVSIPSSVTSIGGRAFYGCSSLGSVTIPEGVTAIGDDAFRGCTSLAGVTIPSSAASIGNDAFSSCDSLERIDVAAGNLAYASVDGVLFSADGTELLRFPGARAGSYEIPSGVTSIGGRAFYGCSSLGSVTIPSSAASIGNDAFSSCDSLERIDVAAGNLAYASVDGVLFSADGTELLRFPGARAGSYEIPSGVTSIGGSAFSGCSSLASVSIPSGVTSIGDYAFYQCSSLENVIIPSGVTSIGGRAFSWCSSLMSVTVPSSVASIGQDAFWGMADPSTVYVSTQAQYDLLNGNGDYVSTYKTKVKLLS